MTKLDSEKLELPPADTQYPFLRMVRSEGSLTEKPRLV